jgi:glycosyltransferase involved in cell wall biosynthesis
MELPVIATPIPGCVDAVRDGETGLLVPVCDTEALTAAIRIYLGDPKLRRQHGANGRHRVLRDFDPGMMREALCQEYLRLLGACDVFGSGKTEFLFRGRARELS